MKNRLSRKLRRSLSLVSWYVTEVVWVLLRTRKLGREWLSALEIIHRKLQLHLPKNPPNSNVVKTSQKISTTIPQKAPLPTPKTRSQCDCPTTSTKSPLKTMRSHSTRSWKLCIIRRLHNQPDTNRTVYQVVTCCGGWSWIKTLLLINWSVTHRGVICSLSRLVIL